MEREFFRKYFIRPIGFANIIRHEEFIVPDDATQDIEYLFELYRNCFQHHVEPNLVTDGTSLLATGDGAKKRLIQNDRITAYFVTRYKPEALTYTESAVKTEQTKKTRTYKQFLEQVGGSPVSADFAQTGNPGSNRVNFLIGTVGVGKSLLLSKVVNEVRRHGIEQSTEKVIPVYVDVEDELRNLDDEFDKIDENFFATILKLTRMELAKHVELLSFAFEQEKDKSLPLKTQIRQLCVGLLNRRDENGAHQPVRFLLVLDNIDRFHFFYSEYAFFKKYRELQLSTIKHNLDNLLKELTVNQLLGDLGMCVVIACRKATLASFAFRSKVLSNKGVSLKDLGVFALTPVHERQAIKARFDLLNEAIAQFEATEPGKYKKYKQVVDQISVLFEMSLAQTPGSNSLRKIADLSHHGTRSFVEFLGALQVDWRVEEKLVDRIFGTGDQATPHHSGNLLRMYLTSLRKRYAQYHRHFPNMYLVDAVISQDSRFPEAHIPHYHTYWLKYLLLKRIHQRTIGDVREIDGIITLDELLEEFVASGAYPESLVLFVLGSLHSADSANCIQIDEPSQGETVRIKISKRGREILMPESVTGNVEFCFCFDYLQIIIDDFHLSLPEAWANEIFVVADLGYLLSRHGIYGLRLKEYMEKKVPATIVFLKTLEAAATAERRARLKNSATISSLFPNFQEVYAKLLDTLSKILPHVIGGDQVLELARSLISAQIADSRYSEFFMVYGSASEPKVEPS